MNFLLNEDWRVSSEMTSDGNIAYAITIKHTDVCSTTVAYFGSHAVSEKCAKLAACAPRMARLLLELQRVYMGSNIGTACPMCECNDDSRVAVHGHYEDCKMLNVLKEACLLDEETKP